MACLGGGLCSLSACGCAYVFDLCCCHFRLELIMVLLLHMLDITMPDLETIFVSCSLPVVAVTVHVCHYCRNIVHLIRFQTNVAASYSRSVHLYTLRYLMEFIVCIQGSVYICRG